MSMTVAPWMLAKTEFERWAGMLRDDPEYAAVAMQEIALLVAEKNRAASALNGLRPCPFCGGAAKAFHKDNTHLPYAGWLVNDVDHWVSCRECGCQTCFFDIKEAAVEVWNTRV